MTILTVGASGSYQTIRAAVEAAAADDVIEVYSGIYREGVKLEKRVTLRAAAGEEPVIDGGWNGQTVEDTFGGTVGCGTEGIVVEGLSIRNCPGRGIGVSASNVTVRGNRIDNCYKGGLGANAPAGTYLSGLLIENNVITRPGQERVVTRGGRVNGSFLFAQVKDSTIRDNVIANGLGEGINIDRGSSGLLVENNMVINSAHVGIYINRATNNTVRGNVVIYTGDTKPLGDRYDAPSGIIIGDENGSGNWPPSAGNKIIDNLIVGSGKLFQVRNNAHNYDTQLDETTLIAGNTFVAGPKTTRGIDILANVQGRPHGAAVVRDNVIHFIYAPENGDIGTNSSGAIDFHNNAWSEQPVLRMRGPGDVYGDPLLVNPAAPLSGDWVGVETGFDERNYRPRPTSPLIGARSDGGGTGALEAERVDPAPHPP
ncbi:MAG TPA: hypothetical protein DHV85_09380, partial [Candidatus Accumulibacter sp.]|nr:hypothetical protein [Accumulibacter sp.]